MAFVVAAFDDALAEVDGIAGRVEVGDVDAIGGDAIIDDPKVADIEVLMDTAPALAIEIGVVLEVGRELNLSELVSVMFSKVAVMTKMGLLSASITSMLVIA